MNDDKNKSSKKELTLADLQNVRGAAVAGRKKARGETDRKFHLESHPPVSF